MFARVTTVQGPADRLEDGVKAFSSLLPRLREMDGWERAYLLVDRDTGKALSVTVWATDETVRASEQAASQMRAQAAESFGGSVEAVETYEVVVEAGSGD